MWKKYFYWITIGQAISMIGSSAVQFALIWHIAKSSQSPILMGIAGFLAFFPSAIFGPIAGLVADRYSRKWVCIIADLTIGLFTAIVAILMSHSIHIAMIFGLLLVRAIGSTFHAPAFQALTPQYVPSQHLLKVGGITQMVVSGCYILGPALGSILYAHFHLSFVLLTDLFGALFACSILFFIPLRPQIKQQSQQHWRKDIQEGFHLLLQDQKLGYLVLAHSLAMVFFLPLSSFYPLLTSQYFQLTPFHASIVQVGYSLGMMLSALWIANIKTKRHLHLAFSGLFGTGITSLLCGIVPASILGWSIFVLICFFMGASQNVYGIPTTVYIQSNIEGHKQGRVFSTLSLLSSIAMPIGLLLTSPIAQKYGVTTLFFLCGIGIIIVVFLMYLKFRKNKKSH